MVRTKKLLLAIGVSRNLRQWRVAQEALEARLGNLGRLLFVNVLLVVAKEVVLFRREACWFKCYLEFMCRLWWSLDIVVITPLYLLDKVKGVLESSFLSTTVSAFSHD
jgi:hypothetical protein